MKKFFAIIITAYTLSSCGYNQMVSLQEDTNKQWGIVQSAYQRRADLIPNLVSTVKGQADFEKGTLEAVIGARAKATQIQISTDDLSPEKLKEFNNAQGELSQALGRLMSVVENYPTLQANQGFMELQAQLEGTENRINTERNRFNESVGAYNSYIRSIPQNMYAGWFNFKAKGYFEASAGSDKAPTVKF
jgi:LemA protein